MVLYLLGIGGMPGWENGHPNISDYPMFAQNLYNVTHSLVVFAAVFGLLWVAARKPVWIVAAWGLHILIDIPTHSLALFPTPFLWPISNFKVDGIGWDNAFVWVTDIVLLVVVYSVGSHLAFSFVSFFRLAMSSRIALRMFSIARSVSAWMRAQSAGVIYLPCSASHASYIR